MTLVTSVWSVTLMQVSLVRDTARSLVRDTTNHPVWSVTLAISVWSVTMQKPPWSVTLMQVSLVRDTSHFSLVRDTNAGQSGP